MAEKEIALLKEQIERLMKKILIWRPGKIILLFSWKGFLGKTVQK